MRKEKRKPVEVISGKRELPAVFYWLLMVVVVLFFYSGTLKNGTALDDVMVLTNNSYVNSGVSGIPDIFLHDSFYGATHKAATQLGWRYRPLSLVMFAVAHEFFGDSWSSYHWLNILLYIGCGIVALGFLRRHVFRDNSWLPALTVIIFLIHPVHAEVVANIKSCDELLALFFTILFLDRLLVWNETSSRRQLLLAMLYYLAALFSKESSVLLAALTPALLYASSAQSPTIVIRKSLPVFVVTMVFVAIRLLVSSIPQTQHDLAAEPYLYATFSQKVATVFLVLGQYLRLSFFPDQLIFDYGYRHIPYVEFSDVRVIVSLIGYSVLLAASAGLIFRRNLIGFFLLAYVSGIVLLSNLFLNVGPVMAERFLFTPGFFLLIAAVSLLSGFIEKRWQGKSSIVVGVLLLVCVPFSYSKVTQRCLEWKDNATLYAADLLKAPESFRVVAFNGLELVSSANQSTDSLSRIERFRKAIDLFHRAYDIYPDYKMMYREWGMAYYALGDIDSAAWAWTRHKELYPTSRYIQIHEDYLRRARFDRQMKIYNENFMKGDLPFLNRVMREAVNYMPEVPNGWLILGKIQFLQGQRDSARTSWKQVLQLDTANAEARSLLMNR